MNILEYCGLGLVSGDIGVEIEMEGSRLLMDPHKWWRATGDGSLRGNGVEWVLRYPVSRKDLQVALDYLVFNSKNSRLDPSDRCGVHVHINCQSMCLREVYMFATLYLMLEPLLMRWCGEDREGNLYCLRAGDAEGLIMSLRDSLEQGDLFVLRTDTLRYASLNFSSLFKFGSLEFRGYGTPKNLMNILKWVDLLLAVRDASLKYKNLPDILEQFSGAGLVGFLKSVFTDKQAESLIHKDAEDDVYDAIRRLQDVAYAPRGYRNSDWTNNKEKEGPLKRKRGGVEELWKQGVIKPVFIENELRIDDGN